MRTYTQVRMELAAAEYDLELSVMLLSTVKAQAEHRAIVAAGGEKQIGTNEDARKRALTIALVDDKEYGEAMHTWFDKREQHGMLKAELECIVFAQRQKESAFKEQMIVLGLVS